jgi:hypothetical protein
MRMRDLILRIFFALIFFMLINFTACSQKTQIQEQNWEGNVITGTVVYMDLEGGFYGIKGDDGNNYDPLNLSSEYQKNGIRIKASISFEKNVSSIRMWGKIIRINQIILIE